MVYILLRLVLQEDDEALRAALGPAGAALLANEGEGDDEREGAVSPSQYSYETLVRLGASPPHTLPPDHTPHSPSASHTVSATLRMRVHEQSRGASQPSVCLEARE